MTGQVAIYYNDDGSRMRYQPVVGYENGQALTVTARGEVVSAVDLGDQLRRRLVVTQQETFLPAPAGCRAVFTAPGRPTRRVAVLLFYVGLDDSPVGLLAEADNPGCMLDVHAYLERIEGEGYVFAGYTVDGDQPEVER